MNKASRTDVPPLIYDPPQEPLSILHVDEHVLVLSKPSGLLSVPGKGADLQDSLELRAKAEFPDALLVHRLDMDTSGIFLMAMNQDSQANLGKQFERRKVDKEYIALVHGELEEDAGDIDLPLRCDWENRPRQMVCFEHGKPAQTAWQVLERKEDRTRMLLKPHTGRSHQLRVHMEQLGHPILGEMFYAPEAVQAMAPRLCLHAQKLTFHHPRDGERVTFTDPAPF